MHVVRILMGNFVVLDSAVPKMLNKIQKWMNENIFDLRFAYLGLIRV